MSDPDNTFAPQIGDELPPLVVPVDRARLASYAQVSGDNNPIHLDEEAAHAVGLPSVIAHGMFTFGAAMTLVSDWAGTHRVIACQTRFTNPVVVPAGECVTVAVSGTVTGRDEAADPPTATVALSVTSDDTAVLGRATATVRIDR